MAWDQIIQQSAIQQGLDPAMFYRQIFQESAGNQYARSGAGAYGPAQVMPGTAANPGFGMRPLPANQMANPDVAIPWAAEYLRKQIDYFGGDVGKGVAAYNAGAGTIQNAVRQGGANWQNFVPGETKKYLQIVRPYDVGNQPQSLGYQPQATQPKPGSVAGVEQPFTPPYGTVNDWHFDVERGRWVDKRDLGVGKAWDQIPSYHLENGNWTPRRATANQPQEAPFSRPNQQTNAPGDPFNIHNWTNPGKSPYAAGDARNAGHKLGEGLRNQSFYGNPDKGNARQWAQDSSGQWFGASQQQPGASDQISGAFRQPMPNLSQYGQGANYMAQLAASGQRIQDQPHFQAPRPQMPITPMGNGMFGYQGGGYSPNGLRLSQMQSGLFGGGMGGMQQPMQQPMPYRPMPQATPLNNGQFNYQGGNYSPAGLALSRQQSGF